MIGHSLTDAERGLSSSATTLANMLALLDAADGHQRLFSRFRPPQQTIRQLHALAASPKISPQSSSVIEHGFSQIEKYVEIIQRAANKAKRTKSVGVVTSIGDDIITTDDVEMAVLAVMNRIKYLREETARYFAKSAEEALPVGISHSSRPRNVQISAPIDD